VIRLLPALAATLLLAALPTATAHAATCAIGSGQEDTFGPSYITSLTQTGTTCTRAKSVVRAYHRCRKAHGGVRGRCPSSVKVLGYRCTEKRGGIPTQFSGKVTCTKGHARIVHTYTQFT
jgi:hypothetical protein